MSQKKITTKKAKTTPENSLLDRVVLILEQARTNVVRAVNSNMVTAYWLIGREIVLELQGGDERAEYGKQVIENLSKQLTNRYGSGFSITSLKYFRTFYLVYQNRLVEIGRPVGDQLVDLSISRPAGDESATVINTVEISRPVGAELTAIHESFSPQLSWSHYRALMRVVKQDARDFYEREAVECCWDKRSLERERKLIEAHLAEQEELSVNTVD
jgi:hypothetical protein